jgi:hypothetical protein
MENVNTSETIHLELFLKLSIDMQKSSFYTARRHNRFFIDSSLAVSKGNHEGKR